MNLQTYIVGVDQALTFAAFTCHVGSTRVMTLTLAAVTRLPLGILSYAFGENIRNNFKIIVIFLVGVHTRKH